MELVKNLRAANSVLLTNIGGVDDKLNRGDRSIKLMVGISLDMYAAADSIATLFENEKYTVIPSIVRDVLENYANIMQLFATYGNEYKRNLLFKKILLDDMDQDRRTYKAMVQDGMTATMQSQADTIIDRLENFIETYFKNEASTVPALPDRVDSVLNIVARLKETINSEFVSEFPQWDNKSHAIADALTKMTVWVRITGHPFEGPSSIYPVLCSETHSNIGSIGERHVKDGAFIIDVYRENIRASISIAECCIREIADSWTKTF